MTARSWTPGTHAATPWRPSPPAPRTRCAGRRSFPAWPIARWWTSAGPPPTSASLPADSRARPPPRPASAACGSNFRMPDVLSVGIGGGSLVHAGAEISVGPDSVGYELGTKALVFGGNMLTATDLAVAAGLADIGDSRRAGRVDRELVRGGLDAIVVTVGAAVDRMRTSPEPLPVVAVGGGSILIPDKLPGSGEVNRPGHYAVANAIGAAIAQVGGEVDRIFALGAATREEVLAAAKAEAAGKAIAAGARPGSVQIVEV